MTSNVSSSKTMHALVWNAGQVQYKDAPAPVITDSRDVLVRVTATTICGSDIHIVDGSIPTMRSGDILGHEFLGIVEEVGSEVKKMKMGQRVIVAFCIACGTCSFCQREEYTGCSTTNPSNLQKNMYGHRTCAMYGYSHLTGGVAGGQAEYVRVPFGDFNCLVIPDSISNDKAVLMTDVIPTAYHGATLGRVREGDLVGIWGLGPVGLMTAYWAKKMGASRVVGIDTVPERLEVARKLGIDTIDFKAKNVMDTIKDMFPEGLDVGIECAGGEYPMSIIDTIERALNVETDTAEIFNEIFMSVRPFGRVAVLGVYIGAANRFPVGAMMEKSLTIRGGQCPVQKYWKKLLKMVEDGDVDPTFIVTHHGKLSEGPEYYQKFIDRKEGILKVILQPDNNISNNI